MVDLERIARTLLDEDERVARAAPPGPWAVDASGSIVSGDGARVIPSVGGALDGRVSLWPEEAVVGHVLAHEPTRALAEVAMKRRLLDELLPDLRQADASIEGEWGSSDDLADRMLEMLLAPYPKCGATAVFYPDDEACEAVCAWPARHGGARHMDESLGSWEEDELVTSYPSE